MVSDERSMVGWKLKRAHDTEYQQDMDKVIIRSVTHHFEDQESILRPNYQKKKKAAPHKPGRDWMVITLESLMGLKKTKNIQSSHWNLTKCSGSVCWPPVP